MGLTFDRADSVVLVVDLQERLMPAIAEGDAVVRRAVVLCGAARLLGVPIVVTEQNPKGLGRTVPDIVPFANDVVEKRHFGATRHPGFLDRLPAGRRTLLVCGAEAHVCVLETVLGLVDAGYRVVLVVDAVGSRRPFDREVALRRLAAHGVELATSEMAVFEWLDSCDDPAFKAAAALIKPL